MSHRRTDAKIPQQKWAGHAQKISKRSVESSEQSRETSGWGSEKEVKVWEGISSRASNFPKVFRMTERATGSVTKPDLGQKQLEDRKPFCRPR